MTDSHTPSQDSSEMRIDPIRAKHLSSTFSSVVTRIEAAKSPNSPPIRLIAVSKLKPANDILHLHTQHSHLHFGENYQQELLQKSLLLPKEIRWHFIGALQTNKCKPLAEQVPNLWCVESVDTSKKADQLEKGRGALVEKELGLNDIPLRVFVQINTSGESEKSGVEPEVAAALCRHIREQCPHLKLQGLMTIGAIARSQAAKEGEENEDFVKLREVRDQVAKELDVGQGELELSMGMSEDFESAIRCGSNEVRVGSTIFGERPARKDAKVKEEIEDGGH
ncbi:PLP dependent protein, partial [Lecanoromycetidae sp. Uapishka_2]